VPQRIQIEQGEDGVINVTTLKLVE